MHRLAVLALLAGCSHVTVRMSGSDEYPGTDAITGDEDRRPCGDFGDFAPDLEGPVSDYLHDHVAHITRIVGAPREEETDMEVETDDGTVRAVRRYCVHVERKDGHAAVTLDLVHYTTS